jgi:hypothetical protein
MEIKGTGKKMFLIYLLNRVEPRLIQRLCVIRHRGVFYFYFFLKGRCLIDFVKTSKQLIGAQGARLLRDEWDR